MDALPDELLLEIFSYLTLEDAVSDRCFLWGLSLVNHRFHNLIKPNLYTKYSFNLGHPVTFLHTISATPALGCYIKSIKWGHTGGYVNSPTSVNLSQKNVDYLIARLRCLSNVSANKLACSRSDLMVDDMNDTDLFLCVFLMFTPNIEELNIIEAELWEHNIFWLKPLAVSPQLFGKLTRVNVTGPLRINNIYPLLLLPTLRTLRLETLTDQRDWHRDTIAEWEINQEFLERLRREGSYVEHFQVARCYRGTTEILDLLGMFHGLKTFDLDRIMAYAAHNETLKNILQSLTSQKSTLETLRLREYGDMSDVGDYRGLENLTSLRSLNIDHKNMVPQEMSTLQILTHLFQQLPASLRQLSLRIHMNEASVFDELVNSLMSISRIIRTFFPALETFAIVDWDPLTGIFPCQTHLGALQTAFSLEGVTFLSQQGECIEDDVLYVLDYVEKDWVWIQPYNTRDEEWLLSINGHPTNQVDVVCSDQSDGWVLVDTMESKWANSGPAIMDEYMAEQPIWYWHELSEQRRRGHNV